MSMTIFGEDTSCMTVRKLFENKNDPACFEEIIVRYLPKIEDVAHEETDCEEDFEELYSSLCECLVDSALAYGGEDSDVKYSHFSTYLGLKIGCWLKWHWRKSKTIDQIIEDFYSVDDADIVLDPELLSGRKIIIGKCIERLTEREKTVIYMRYGLQMTFDEVAKNLKVGRERVRQIEAKSLRKCRERACKNKIKIFDAV